MHDVINECSRFEKRIIRKVEDALASLALVLSNMTIGKEITLAAKS